MNLLDLVNLLKITLSQTFFFFSEVGSVAVKPKRRPYLLKRKALTTGIFDANRKEDEKNKGNKNKFYNHQLFVRIGSIVVIDRMKLSTVELNTIFYYFSF